MDQLSLKTRSGVETISLSIITEGSKEYPVGGGLQPFGSSGARLYNMTMKPIIINFNHASDTISRWRNGYRNTSLGSLESCV